MRRITLTHTSGWWPWKRTVTRTYEGDCTVWHDVDTGRRPDSLIESQLADHAWHLDKTEIDAARLKFLESYKSWMESKRAM